MNTTTDIPELWSAAWQRVDPGPANLDLRRIVRRDRSRLTTVVAIEALVVIGVLGYAIDLVRPSPSLEGVLWVASLAFFSAIAIAFNAWNRSGLWRACADSTTAYVVLSIDRCCARLLAARFAVALALVESAFVLAWHGVTGWMNGNVLSDKLLQSILLLAVINIALLVFTRYYSRRTRRELDRLRRIRTELGGSGA